MSDPLRMKRVVGLAAVGTEVGISLVRYSPILSWTVGPWSTPDCRQSADLVVEHAY